MKKIVNFLISGLFVVEMASAQNIRRDILPDKYGIHELAFPDTTNYTKMVEKLKPFVNNYGENSHVLEALFESKNDSSRFYSFLVQYNVKWTNDLKGEYEIDSTKAPKSIITMSRWDGELTDYQYDGKLKKYVRTKEITPVREGVKRI